MENQVQPPFIPSLPIVHSYNLGLIALLLSSYGNPVNIYITELTFHNPFKKLSYFLVSFARVTILFSLPM